MHKSAVLGKPATLHPLVFPITIQGSLACHHHTPAEEKTPRRTLHLSLPASRSQNLCLPLGTRQLSRKPSRTATCTPASFCLHGTGLRCPSGFYPLPVTPCSHGIREEPGCVEEGSQEGAEACLPSPLKSIPAGASSAMKHGVDGCE